MGPEKLASKELLPFHQRVGTTGETRVLLSSSKYTGKLTFDKSPKKIDRDLGLNVPRIAWASLVKEFEDAKKNLKRKIPIGELHEADDVKALHAQLTSLEGSTSKPKTKKKKKVDQTTETNIKDARRKWNEAKNYTKDADWIKVLTNRAETLRGYHKRGVVATKQLEDFLYYQNTIHRAWRIGIFDKRKTRAEKAAVDAPRPGTVMDVDEYRHDLYSLQEDHPGSNWISALLDRYDETHVGVREGIEGAQFPRLRENIPPDQLHLWTPMTRRIIGTSVATDSLTLNIDFEALEKKRQEVENDRGSLLSDPTMTHSARRAALGGRPGIDVLPTAGGGIGNFTERGTFTDAGLWVSAAETSHDWLTSYDCIGPAMTSWIRNDSLPDLHQDTIEREDAQGNVWDKERDGPDNTHRSRNSKRWAYATTWAEETYGRREHHFNAGLDPSSPPESPPLNPLDTESLDNRYWYQPLQLPDDQDLVPDRVDDEILHHGTAMQTYQEVLPEAEDTGIETHHEASDTGLGSGAPSGAATVAGSHASGTNGTENDPSGGVVGQKDDSVTNDTTVIEVESDEDADKDIQDLFTDSYIAASTAIAGAVGPP